MGYFQANKFNGGNVKYKVGGNPIESLLDIFKAYCDKINSSIYTDFMVQYYSRYDQSDPRDVDEYIVDNFNTFIDNNKGIEISKKDNAILLKILSQIKEKIEFDKEKNESAEDMQKIENELKKTIEPTMSEIANIHNAVLNTSSEIDPELTNESVTVNNKHNEEFLDQVFSNLTTINNKLQEI